MCERVNTCVVVPTNRPERAKRFCEAWESQLRRPDVQVTIVNDGPELLMDALPDWLLQYCWGDIAENIRNASACIPTRSGGVRDFGFWLACQSDWAHVILTLDDDVLPATPNIIEAHLTALEVEQPTRWQSSVPGYPVRGLPREDPRAKPVVNHGLWAGVPDVDALTQLRQPSLLEGFAGYVPSEHYSVAIPRGVYQPFCIMNVAFRREVAPLMWMPVLPEGCKRWDDMWCGVVLKRVCDLHGLTIANGWPHVYHERASDPLNNLAREHLGYGIHEELWRVVETIERVYDKPLATWLRVWREIGHRFTILAETARLAEMWAELWGVQR